jgi:hypothetical protein
MVPLYERDSMVRLIQPWAAAVILFLAVPSAHSEVECRFGIDTALDLEELVQRDGIVSRVTRSEDVFHVDASAVVEVDFEKLLESTLDFENYVTIGMPHLKSSRIVERRGDQLFTWNWMSGFGFTSKHYSAIQVQRDLAPSPHGRRAAATVWRLEPKHPEWTYEENRAVSSLCGSWYIEELSRDSEERPKIYVRYYLAIEIDVWIPSFILSLVVNQDLRNGAMKVIQRHRDEALRRMHPTKTRSTATQDLTPRP